MARLQVGQSQARSACEAIEQAIGTRQVHLLDPCAHGIEKLLAQQSQVFFGPGEELVRVLAGHIGRGAQFGLEVAKGELRPTVECLDPLG